MTRAAFVASPPLQPYNLINQPIGTNTFQERRAEMAVIFHYFSIFIGRLGALWCTIFTNYEVCKLVLLLCMCVLEGFYDL